MTPNKNNVLVTGIPRSGSTLLMQIINKSYSNIVLSEPTWIKTLRSECNDEPNALTHLIYKKIKALRKLIASGKSIEVLVDSRTGKLPQNFYIRKKESKQQVDNIKSFVEFKFPSNYYNKDIYIKNNTLFTALLPELTQSSFFNIVAIIREPIAVLKSWRSLDIPVSDGKLKIAEHYSQDIIEISKIPCLLERQVKILDWFYKQYYLLNNGINVIKYEDLITDPEKQIKKVSSEKISLDIKLSSKNQSKYYNHDETETLKAALTEFGKYHTKFYP